MSKVEIIANVYILYIYIRTGNAIVETYLYTYVKVRTRFSLNTETAFKGKLCTLRYFLRDKNISILHICNEFHFSSIQCSLAYIKKTDLIK